MQLDFRFRNKMKARSESDGNHGLKEIGVDGVYVSDAAGVRKNLRRFLTETRGRVAE
jgi:hypothetical protein